MVAAELLVVTGLVYAALSMAMQARVSAAPPQATLPQVAASEPPSPLPDLPVRGAPGSRGPSPGLNVDALFWRTRLAQLNADQVVLEQLEWRIVHAAMDAARRYVELTVLPSIQRAEHAGGGRSAVAA